MPYAPFKATAVTPSDTVDLPGGRALHGLLVITAGNVVFHDGTGDTVTITGAAANSHINIQAKRVLATGTTAVVRALY